MKLNMPTERHVSLMNAFKGALASHTDLSGAEMLAIASQFVGNLIAAQDQTQYTPEAVMKLVSGNIQIGNQAALEALLSSQGRA